MKLESDAFNGRRTGEGPHQQQQGNSAHFPDDLVTTPPPVDLLAGPIQRDGKGGLNHKFRGKAARLLVGSGMPDAALSDAFSAAVFSLAGTEGCASQRPPKRKSVVNLSGRSSLFRAKRLKGMRARKDVARAIFVAKSAAGIDIETHSEVGRFSLLPEDVSLYLVFDGSEAVLR